MSAFTFVLVAFGGLTLGTVTLVLTVILLLLVAPFFKKTLVDNPDVPDKISIFTELESGHSSIIMRGSNIEHIIHGKEKGAELTEEEQFKNLFLSAYDRYAFKFGLRFIGIPNVHSVRSYDLPRYRKVEENGKLTYAAVQKGAPGRRTNHYRTQITPWYNEFTSVDIEGVPFDVKCATNVRIEREKIEGVAFNIESWNVLLDQALNAVTRGTLREKITLDDAIGGISQDIWHEHQGNETRTEDGKGSVQGEILERLHNHKLKNGQTLMDMGIVIEGFEILDFAPEGLSSAELEKLRSPALERRVAQARAMAGKAEASYQNEVLAVLAKYPELAKINVDAEAFVKAAKAGSLDALVAGLLKQLVK